MTQRTTRPWADPSGEPARGVVGSAPGAEMFDDSDRRPRYEILRVVNRGGMGEIALARAIGVKGFEKLVVLKRLRADAEREDHIQMFDVEQEVMSRIEHPNIVKVFDQPYVEGTPYMAMEYIRGRNLDQIVRAAMQGGDELPLNLTLTVISEVLRGLAFVHRLKDSEGRPLGVVHQDMTPSNVLVSFFGEVKVTDFGISYVTSRDGGLRKGVLKGKPRYVAPEVLAGKRVNNRADIYGVGVVMYELLTGRALFARPSVKETLAAVARNELPDFQTELARFGGVASILERCLHKDPSERYRTAEAMAADVINELSKRGGPMPPATLGYLVRNLFRNDPDVPEVDPDLEQAISRGSIPEPGAQPTPRNLDDTLQELDRLLGSSKSVDLFTLPPELAIELDDLEDMEPFSGETPLPDFVWQAKSEREILEKAKHLFDEEQGSLVGEPPPLFGDDTPTTPNSTPNSTPPHRAVTAPAEHPAPDTPERRQLSGTTTAPVDVGVAWAPGAGPRARTPETPGRSAGPSSAEARVGRFGTPSPPSAPASTAAPVAPPVSFDAREAEARAPAPPIAPTPAKSPAAPTSPAPGATTPRGSEATAPRAAERNGAAPALEGPGAVLPDHRAAFWRGLILGAAIGASGAAAAFLFLGF